MNKQFKIVNGQKVNTKIEWTDYTFNPIAGCLHGCAWTMPDNTIANCYAEDVAERLAQAAYPNGFEHHYWRPESLNEPLKLKMPAKIFCGSMADVFGHWVPTDQIQTVLDVCRRADWHTFQFLTKNPKRLPQFDFPTNCWVGISSPPDQMWGKPLNYRQKRAWLSTSLIALNTCNARVKWMSVEPLSWDIADSLTWEDEAGDIFIPDLDWVVIGAASDGPRLHQPKPEWVENVLDLMDCTVGASVFFKGNLRGNPAAVPWREEFPFPTLCQHDWRENGDGADYYCARCHALLSRDTHQRRLFS